VSSLQKKSRQIRRFHPTSRVDRVAELSAVRLPRGGDTLGRSQVPAPLAAAIRADQHTNRIIWPLRADAPRSAHPHIRPVLSRPTARSAPRPRGGVIGREFGDLERDKLAVAARATVFIVLENPTLPRWPLSCQPLSAVIITTRKSQVAPRAAGCIGQVQSATSVGMATGIRFQPLD
jgi:hypothetical protein